MAKCSSQQLMRTGGGGQGCRTCRERARKELMTKGGEARAEGWSEGEGKEELRRIKNAAGEFNKS